MTEERQTPVEGPEGLLLRAERIAQGARLAEEYGERPPDVGRLAALAPGVALDALDRILVSPEASAGLHCLHETGALAVLLPEVSAMVDFHRSSPVHHKDLWAHTLQVVEQTPPDADLRWVALLHDCGKIATRFIGEDGKVTFLRHEQVGALQARGVGGRLGMPNERVERIAFVVEHHGRLNAYESQWSDKALRRLARDAGDRLEDLLAFSAADFTTGRHQRRRSIHRRISELRERLDGLDSGGEGILPGGLAEVLMDRLNLEPGPEVGEILRFIEVEICAERLTATAPIEELVEAAKRWRSQRV